MKMSAVGGITLAVAISGMAGSAAAVSNPKQEMLDQGAEDYRIHCASCHGTDATGQGPVAAFLVRKPVDLTTLAARNGGEFPMDGVYWVIDGRGDVAAHGPREMPVWGEQFGGPEESEAKTRERILGIIAYLKTLQRGMPANGKPNE